ncbi:MAG: N-6 DNA methylase [Gammaproteobacteria bacterium]|nr:N-6 DNA methylase [Gammaproteobacteria bacterium]
MDGNATETAYNFALARLLREEGLSAGAEQRHRFGKRRGQADVLLDFDDYAVVIETEFGDPAREDANKRFPDQQPAIINGLPVRLVVALGYPQRLADLPESKTHKNLAVCDNLRIVYRYYGEEWSEETTGRVADLAETLRNYWVQSDSGTGIDLIVQRAANAINDASNILARSKQNDNAEQDESATKALIWLNALLFQELLACYLDRAQLPTEHQNRGIKRPDPDQGPTHLIAQWDEILNINWWPIFFIARETLSETPGPANKEAVNVLKTAAAEIAESGVIRRHDVAGRIFHRLPDSRKFLATNYTTIPAAIMLAGLAFDERSPCWSDTDFAAPDKIAGLRVVDPACGSGTLLMAAAQEILKCARRNSASGEDNRELVRAILEDAVYGFDVVPAAIHLAASTLCMAESSQVIKDMNLWRVQHEIVSGVPRLGSLDFLASSPSQGNAGRLDLFDDEKFTRMTGQGEVADNAAMPQNCDLIIANPPYTRAGGPGDEANTLWNPIFGSLFDRDDSDKMKAALQKTLAKTPANLYAGLGSGFVVLADDNLKANGRLAFVLPATMLTGSRWRGIRQLLLENYCIDWIIVSHDNRHRSKVKGLPGRLLVSFSESTRIAEVLIIATKNRQQASRNRVRFVNLLHNPDEPVQAMTLTRKLLAMEENAVSFEARGIDIGGKHYGNFIVVPQEHLTDGAWQYAAFVQPDLVLHADHLRRTDYNTSPKVPIIEIGNIAELGPYEMQVKNPTQGLFTIVETDDPLRAGIPALWHHSSTRETSLQVTANARLERRPDRDKEKQDRMLAQQCRLHLARDLRMAPQRLAAVLTDKPMLGVRSWVTLALHDDMPGKQETLCLWLNSTPGLLMRILHGNRPYLGRSSVPHELIRTLPALDVNRLSTEQLTAAAAIYEDLKNKTLQGFSYIQDDPVRNELNARLCTEVLDIDGNSVETLTDSIREPGYEAENLEELVVELTHKLALEPTMHARH